MEYHHHHHITQKYCCQMQKSSPPNQIATYFFAHLKRMHLFRIFSKCPTQARFLTWISTPGWFSEWILNMCARLVGMVASRVVSTPGCLSESVVNVWIHLVGMVVLRLMSVVITPPAVSIPRDRGATSSSSKSLDLLRFVTVKNGSLDSCNSSSTNNSQWRALRSTFKPKGLTPKGINSPAP